MGGWEGRDNAQLKLNGTQIAPFIVGSTFGGVCGSREIFGHTRVQHRPRRPPAVAWQKLSSRELLQASLCQVISNRPPAVSQTKVACKLPTHL